MSGPLNLEHIEREYRRHGAVTGSTAELLVARVRELEAALRPLVETEPLVEEQRWLDMHCGYCKEVAPTIGPESTWTMFPHAPDCPWWQAKALVKP